MKKYDGQAINLSQQGRFDVKVLSYYDMDRLALDNRTEECTVTCRSGEITKFDEMIVLNNKWIFRCNWIKRGTVFIKYYTLSAKNAITGKDMHIDVQPSEKCDYIYGLVNYTDYRYFIIMRSKTIQIFVYQGKTAHLITFWDMVRKGKSSDEKYHLDIEISALIDNATPV